MAWHLLTRLLWLWCLFLSLRWDRKTAGAGSRLENWALIVSFPLECCCSVVKSCLTLRPPWTAAFQASLSSTVSRSFLKLMSIEVVIISNHLILFSSCLQSFPASRSFLMNQLFASRGQSIGASALASFLLVNIPLECRSLLQRRLSAYFPVWSCSLLARSVRGSWILLVRIWWLLGPSQTVVPMSFLHSY